MTSRLRQTTALLLLLSSALMGLTFACATQLRPPKAESHLVRAERQAQREMWFAERMRRELRVYSVASRVRVGGAELCPDLAWDAGMWVAHLNHFPRQTRRLASRYFKLSSHVRVLAIVEGLPAYEAGLREGDLVEHVDGKRVQSGSAVSSKLVGPEAHTITVLRDGQRVERRLEPWLACREPAAVVNGSVLNAWADGDRIFLTTAMLRFVESDDELAVVIGHEFAHNVLDHHNRQRMNQLAGSLLGAMIDFAAAAAGVDTQGEGTRTGASAGARAFSQGFESEADYLGLYFAHRAGYDPAEGPEFWRRMAIEHPGGIEHSYGSTHPSSPQRAVAMRAIVKEIETKDAHSLPLVPAWKDGRAQPMADRAGSRRTLDPAKTSLAVTRRIELADAVADRADRLGRLAGRAALWSRRIIAGRACSL